MRMPGNSGNTVVFEASERTKRDWETKMCDGCGHDLDEDEFCTIAMTTECVSPY